MNILFDLISAQKSVNGGGEYTKRLFKELSSRPDCTLFGLYDSRLKFIGQDQAFFLSSCEKLVDIKQHTISEYILMYQIDILFIGIVQRYFQYNLKDINCKVVATLHDIGDVEAYSNNLHFLFRKNLKGWLRINSDFIPWASKYLGINRIMRKYNRNMYFLAQGNTHLLTVSNYSLSSIRYYLPTLRKKSISVLYPPEKITPEITDDIRNNLVRKAISENLKYFLIVNANRENKNAPFVHKVFLRIQKEFPDFHLFIVGDNTFEGQNVFSLDFISTNDLNILYKNAYALIYASMYEGFGYPPLEAMKYGTPVLSSNVCSMPEVLGDSVVYFSPYYENDLYYKIIHLMGNRTHYAQEATKRYGTVAEKQKEDLKATIDLISKI